MARNRSREPTRPATLGELRRHCPWIWVHCARGYCLNKVPVALAPFIIRWGAEASGDLLRTRMRCTACGSLGATLQHPSIDGRNMIAPFPGGGGTNLASRD
jgi:hypothetical protein